jgi:mycothiol synthase
MEKSPEVLPRGTCAAPRRYRDAGDLARMLALLQAGRAARSGTYYVHTGDLQWWLYYPPLGTACWEHIYLWEDPAQGQHLQGWALLDPNGDSFDVYFQPELRGTALAEGMLAWAENALIPLARAAGRKQAGMFWVTPEDGFRSLWLKERGYHVTYQDTALARPLAAPIQDIRIPHGFVVRTCLGLQEVEARARAQHNAFGSSAPFEAYVQRFTGFMQSPVYSPAADVVAAAPDGRIAAFCIIWTDEVNRVGLFEPVGTDPEFQRQGLGKAVMLEALRRLQAQGMHQAIVCTSENNIAALQLYASVGFQPYNTFQFYARELA